MTALQYTLFTKPPNPARPQTEGFALGGSLSDQKPGTVFVLCTQRGRTNQLLAPQVAHNLSQTLLSKAHLPPGQAIGQTVEQIAQQTAQMELNGEPVIFEFMLVWVLEGWVYTAHLGQGNIYRWRGNQAETLSLGWSREKYLLELYRAGLISYAEIPTLKQEGLIDLSYPYSLSNEPSADGLPYVEYHNKEWLNNDVIILATAGLTLEPQELVKLTYQHQTKENWPQLLSELNQNPKFHHFSIVAFWHSQVL